MYNVKFLIPFGILYQGVYSMLFIPKSEQGQGLVEYAFLLVLVAVTVLVVLVFLGGSIGNIYSNLINQI